MRREKENRKQEVCRAAASPSLIPILHVLPLWFHFRLSLKCSEIHLHLSSHLHFTTDFFLFFIFFLFFLFLYMIMKICSRNL